MFKWALAEDRIPENPTLGVTRQKTSTTGYQTWSEQQIAQYRHRHPLGTMARLALELLLSTAARRGDVVRLWPQRAHDGIITFEQSKVKRTGETPIVIPLHPDFLEALNAMTPSKLAPLNEVPPFLITTFGRPFKSAASFGNWFRQRCDEVGLSKGLSAHGLRKATARRLAELGCTTLQIAAVTGHATLSEVQRYTAETGHGADSLPVSSKLSARLLGACTHQTIDKDSAVHGACAGSSHANDGDFSIV
jgi:integrase/recombinase XerD